MVVDVDYGRRKQFVAHMYYRRRRYFVVDNVNFDNAFIVVNDSVSTFEIRKHPTFCHLQRNLFSSPKHTFANVVLSYINNINQDCQRKYGTIYVFILIFTPWWTIIELVEVQISTECIHYITKGRWKLQIITSPMV